MTGNRYNPLLHWTACVTTVSTLLLIFMGGLVTSKGAGMAVPDWPNSYGYNMWLFPPSLWWNDSGIFYEHSHRLMGTFVGLLSIFLCVIAYRSEPRKWVRVLMYGVLVFVCFQGLLGGLRVLLVNLDLAILHGITAQLFLCTAVLAAMVTSRWWAQVPNLAWSIDHEAGRRLIGVAWVAVAVVMLQLVVGAVMRHYNAGLAIHDLPLAYGRVLPPTSPEDMTAANAMRSAALDREREALIAANDPHAAGIRSEPVTMGQAWLHFGHRLGAILASVAILWLIVKILGRHRDRRVLTVPAVVLGVLLVTQVTLGVYTVIERKPADVASAHVAVGATVLAVCFMLAVRSMRLYSRRYRTAGDSAPVDVRSIDPRTFLAA